MGQGIGEVLTFAVGVAISPIPIIAVILMLFSRRARVNGPAFLLGWVVALAAVAGIACALASSSDAASGGSAADTIAWGKVVLGVVLLGMARRHWAKRPAPGAEPEMPRWMASVEELAPLKALALGIALVAANPKNLILAIGAGTGLGQLALSTSDQIVAVAVFVVVASLTIAGPVVYYLVGGDHARAALDGLKTWLTAHNDAVMAVLLLVFGVDLIAKGLPPITG